MAETVALQGWLLPNFMDVSLRITLTEQVSEPNPRAMSLKQVNTTAQRVAIFGPSTIPQFCTSLTRAVLR